MARFTNAAINSFAAGYDAASPNKDKSGKTAYQRYIEKYYGPGVESHNDPLAVARAATGAVAQGLKSGAGFLSHAAAGLLGAPMGSSQQGSRAAASATNTGGGIGSDTGAVSGITPTNRLYGGNPGTGAGVSAYVPGTTRQGMDGVLDAISRAEGTVKNGYNEILGSGVYGRPSKPITEMTLQEVHDFGRKTLFAGQRAAGKTGPLSSATGRYQITGDNIKAYSTKWGLDMKTTKWTPQLQDRIAIDLAKNTPKGLANWEGFKYGDGKKLKQQATTALAYASTGATTTPALQAAAEQASGRATSSRYERSPEIAAMQRDLNSRGAKLTVDGIRGPLTQAAEKQFLGSPTSVRTPSFTSTPTTSPQATSANNWSSLQGSPVSTVNQRQDYVPTPGFVNRQSYTSGRGDEGTLPRTGVAPTPAINQPYTNYGWADNSLNRQNELRDEAASQRYRDFENQRAAARTIPAGAQYAYANSTGGSINPNVRSVPVVAIRSDVAHQSPLPGYYNDQTASGMTITGGRRVPVSTGYSPTTAPVLTGGFSRPAVPQTPYLNQPYTTTTGGANAIVAPTQTARIPQARPDYQPPQQAVPTLLERLDNLVERAERALGGNRGSDSRSSGGRSGGGGAGSPNSGLGYSGGRGYGGGSIGRGTGGAINPNR